jgi:hypothetical protein
VCTFCCRLASSDSAADSLAMRAAVLLALASASRSLTWCCRTTASCFCSFVAQASSFQRDRSQRKCKMELCCVQNCFCCAIDSPRGVQLQLCFRMTRRLASQEPMILWLAPSRMFCSRTMNYMWRKVEGHRSSGL